LFETIQHCDFTCHHKATPQRRLQEICVEEWARILGTSEAHVTVKGQFYMGLHLLRMVPFRLKVSEEQALYALANGVRWISRALAAA